MQLISVEDFRKEAQKRLSGHIYKYFAYGASNNQTVEENIRALKKWFILPTVMRDVSRQRSTKTTILGAPISAPIGIAPTAFHKLANSGGECGTARAASDMNVPFVLSLHSNSSIEELCKAVPDSIKLMQFYPLKDRNFAINLFKKVERFGFKGLVMTVDYAAIGCRKRLFTTGRLCHTNDFKIMQGLDLTNLKPGEPEAYVETFATWEYAKWVKSVTSLPLIVKGVLSSKDALLALEAGVDAIWVSNHGGRQVDCVLPTMEALPAVLSAVDKKCPVYVDGGFETGSDVFKALALGADMVFLGRPIIWALTCEGEKGVRNILGVIKREFSSAMINSGCSTVKDIRRELLVVRSYLHAHL